jgi:hypothetical protein
LQKDGISGETTYCDSPINIPIPVVKAMFPLPEAASLAAWLKTEEGSGVAWMLDGLENPDINHPTFAQLLGYLATVVEVISMETVISVLDMGQRLKTRSEELFARQLTLDEIWEAYNG